MCPRTYCLPGISELKCNFGSGRSAILLIASENLGAEKRVPKKFRELMVQVPTTNKSQVAVNVVEDDDGPGFCSILNETV